MKKVWIGLGLLLVVVAVVLAQLPSRDSITRVGDAPNQQYNTYVVDAGKAIAYAKQVMRGSPTDASGESVESALVRIDYRLDNLSIDWNDVTNKPLLGGGSAVQSLNADRVRWTDDAGGIFGTGTQNVAQALTYLDDVTVDQWGGVLPWGRIGGAPATWEWSRVSGRPSVWPGTLGATRVTWSSDADGIFGIGTRNVADALSYLDNYGPASRWPTWSDVRTQSGTGLQATDVKMDTSGFNGYLGSVHSNAQFVGDALDDVIEKYTWGGTASMTTTSDGTGEDPDRVVIHRRQAYRVGDGVFISGYFNMDGDWGTAYVTLPLPVSTTVSANQYITVNTGNTDIIYETEGYANANGVRITVIKQGTHRPSVTAQDVGVRFSGFYFRK